MKPDIGKPIEKMLDQRVHIYVLDRLKREWIGLQRVCKSWGLVREKGLERGKVSKNEKKHNLSSVVIAKGVISKGMFSYTACVVHFNSIR